MTEHAQRSLWERIGIYRNGYEFIYIYIERERDIYIYIYITSNIKCKKQKTNIYIYIYIHNIYKCVAFRCLFSMNSISVFLLLHDYNFCLTAPWIQALRDL